MKATSEVRVPPQPDGQSPESAHLWVYPDHPVQKALRRGHAIVRLATWRFFELRLHMVRPERENIGITSASPRFNLGNAYQNTTLLPRGNRLSGTRVVFVRV